MRLNKLIQRDKQEIISMYALCYRILTILYEVHTCDNISLYPDNEIAQQGSSVCNKRIETHNYNYVNSVLNKNDDQPNLV